MLKLFDRQLESSIITPIYYPFLGSWILTSTGFCENLDMNQRFGREIREKT